MGINFETPEEARIAADKLVNEMCRQLHEWGFATVVAVGDADHLDKNSFFMGYFHGNALTCIGLTHQVMGCLQKTVQERSFPLT
jgi:hypothetical protein